MNRLRLRVPAAFLMLCAAFFALAAGNAVAASGTAPTVNGGDPPAVGAQLSATPSVLGDSTGWEPCDQIGTAYPATSPIDQAYTLSSVDIGNPVCAVEFDPTFSIDGVSDPVAPPGFPTPGQLVTEGQTLSVTSGAWADGVAPTDQWESCDASGNCSQDPPGASYVIGRQDVGQTIGVSESASPGSTPSIPGGSSGVVAAIPPVPDPSNPPTVTGTPQVGDTLTASAGGWSNDPTSYTYQWERCSGGCTTIFTDTTSATQSTYVPVRADAEDSIAVVITASIYPGTAYGSTSQPIVAATGSVSNLSSSPPPPNPPSTTVVPVVNARSHAIGRLTATMLWTFRYAPKETEIMALAVNGPAVGSLITTRCTGVGCPFTVRRTRVRDLKRCRAKGPSHCRGPRTVDLEPAFRGRKLRVGSQVTVMISRRRDIGKDYRFLIRRRRAPSVRISCLAPGSVVPGRACTGV